MSRSKFIAALVLALWCLSDANQEASFTNGILGEIVEGEDGGGVAGVVGTPAPNQLLRGHKHAENLRLKLAGHVHPDALHAAKRETRTVGKEIKRDHAETMLAIRSQQEEDLRTCQGNLQSLLEQKTSRVPDLHRLLAPQVTASSSHTGPNPRC